MLRQLSINPSTKQRGTTHLTTAHYCLSTVSVKEKQAIYEHICKTHWQNIVAWSVSGEGWLKCRQRSSAGRGVEHLKWTWSKTHSMHRSNLANERTFYFTHKCMNNMHNNKGHSSNNVTCSSNDNNHRTVTALLLTTLVQLSTNQVAMYSPETMPLAREFFM